MARILVGVSGWSYPRWRGDFYPRGLVQRRELEYVASKTTSVELNGSFYSLQRPATYRRLRDETPDGFQIAVKGSRYITQMKKLAGVETALANFFASGVLELGEKLGPILWQLPPNLGYDADRLGAFLDLLPRTTEEMAELAAGHDDKHTEDRVSTEVRHRGRVRHALEVRHASYSSEQATALLRDRDVALVLADSPRRWPFLDEDTSDFRYARLHGHSELYASGYSARLLDEWADRVRAWVAAGRDAYVYFDNDARGHAPHDAVALLDRLR